MGVIGMKYNWLNDVDPVLLEGDYRTIAEKCGLETLITLLNEFEKSTVYFSKGLLASAVRQFIIKHKEKSSTWLAKELNLSERYIQKILREHRLEEAALKPIRKNKKYC